ncbi:ABC transporter permease subunit [Frisingicoccus sp.]|uniref:ABC transporter permease subunit n=1 Tax=Frisingicoccus sp. TaxID=1918627 RepID=UPI00399B1C30
MSKLLASNFIRIRCSLSFCLSLAFILAWNALMLFSTYEVMTKYDDKITLDSMLFSFLIIIGIILSVVISLFIGTDYNDGTIRNKILIGHSRQHIYMSNFITCALVGVILSVWGIIVNLAIGIPLFGTPELALKGLAIMIGDSILACIAYTSIYNMIGMLCSNKSHTVMICILSSVVLSFASIYLYSVLSQPEIVDTAVSVNGNFSVEQMPNPMYLTGIKREIYQFFMDFLPSGQCAQLANLEVLHPYRIGIYSIVIIAVTNFLGLLLFNKKDIK